MDTLKHDLLHALRNLRKSPGFAAVTVLTLALGIGANTAIFSVVNGVVLRPLGYPKPQQLIFITSQFPGLGFDQFWISTPEFLEFRERNQSFQSVGGYRTGGANLGGGDIPRRVVSALVTPGLFSALSVQPVRGRGLVDDDSLPGVPDVAVLSYDLWRAAFAGDESAIGRVVDINGVKTAIVGIMPKGFDVHDQGVELWLPATIDPAQPGGRGSHFLHLIGRLKNDISLAQARADLEAMLVRWPQLNPGTHAPNPVGHRLRFDELQADIVGNVRTALWVLQGAVGFVLLIACANLGNLLLARAESRQKEFAIRTALGAGRMRLLRQFMTEGVVLSLLGATLGVGLAAAGVRAILVANPDSVPRSSEIAVDPVVLGFTLLVALATGLLFGLAPLLHLTSGSMNTSLKEGGQRTTAGTARARMRQVLVMAEVALAVVLVIGAGLLLRSFWNLMSVDAGFDRSRLVTFAVTLPQGTYTQQPQRASFYERLIAQLRSTPGMQTVAGMTGLPPRRDVNANDTAFEGVEQTAELPQNVDYYQTVTAAYVDTMGIPVVDGRSFTESDVGGPPVVLVNEALAKRFYPKTNPIGRRLRTGGAQSPWLTIVGVLKDVKQGGLDAKTGTELYLLYGQSSRLGGFAPANMNMVLRSNLPLASLASTIQATVGAIDSSLPIVNLRTMEDVFAESVSRPRFLAQLLGLFAGLALVLAAIGTYGLLSYSVTERRQEIGIRMALGATRRGVMALILRQGLQLAAIGLVAGLVCSLYLTRVMQTLLFEVKPDDPLTLVAVATFITAVAIVACYLPAHRATRVDPMRVLRED